MFKQISDIKGNGLLVLKINLGLSEGEQEEIGRLLEQRVKDRGGIRLLLILGDYPSVDFAESLYEDLKFVKLAQDKIDRLAVVGESAWQETWIGLFSLFGGVEAAYFENSDLDDAVQWLNRKS